MKGIKGKAKRVTIRKVGRDIWLPCLIISAAVLGLLTTTDTIGQTCPERPLDMISWWTGDGDANDIQDGNHGTLQNGATFAAGMVGQSFSLDGVNDEVKVPYAANLNPTGALTLDAWINLDSLSNDANGGYQAVVAMSEGQRAYSLSITGTGPNHIGTAGNVHLEGSGVGEAWITSAVAITPGQWHHIAGVIEPSTNRFEIYVDGVLQPIVNSQGGPQLALVSNVAFRVGFSDPGNPYHFRGRIDEVEIYNRALSDAEIQDIVNAGSDCDDTPPTFGSCPMGGPFLLNSGLQLVGPISAEDPESGINTGLSTLSGSVDTSFVGTKTVTFIAVNNEGLQSTKDCNYDVQYNFIGFFQPIDNNVPNSAKAGQAIPIKWRITDASGVPISDPNSFVNVSSFATLGACGGTADAIEIYTGSSGLQYLGDGYWQFNWKTPQAYKGQCRTMSLNLYDGALWRTATFIFK